MQEIIIKIMESYGYLGIFLLITLENIFPPIPSEVILLFGGFMTTKTTLSILGVVAVSTLGSLAGAFILYYVGRILNKERLIKIVSGKIGKVLRLNKNDIEKADEWFRERGEKTVFFCRFVPIVRSLISIPAGMSGMPLLKFGFYTIVGTVIWNTVLTLLGHFMGNKWEQILVIFDTYSNIVLIVLCILVVLFLVYKLKKRKRK